MLGMLKLRVTNGLTFLVFLFFTIILFLKPLYAQSLEKITPIDRPEIGLWATKENDGVFQIFACGQKLCGRFVGMQYTTALPPNSKYGHSQCNFLMLRDFTPNKSGDRWSGTIYDPRDEKAYSAYIWLNHHNELKLRGYLGISLFGETQVWHRFQGTILQNCLLPNS